MKDNKTTLYKHNECKTEFLFESDAEKVVLKEALKPKKKKTYKLVLINCFLICLFLTILSFSLTSYKNQELSKISASINQIKAKKELNEKLNKSSDNLKKVNNDYNKKYEIIVNKSNPIDQSLVDSYNYVTVSDNLYKGILLEEETYNSYLKLKENLLQRNYYINIRSGFRTFQDSVNIYNTFKIQKGEKYANTYVAPPGTSEHNLGIAFDFIISTNKNTYETNFDSDEYFYLENIAYLYGFIIRYPKEKENITGYSYEPWHLRYVGTDLAKYLKKNNLTLEEYYN